MSEVKSTKPASSKQTAAKLKSAPWTAKTSLSAMTLEDATEDQVKALEAEIGLAYKKPSWAAEQGRTERKLWEVAALASDISPEWRGIRARRKADEKWNQHYASMQKAMCDALLPERNTEDIYYNPTRPANVALLGKTQSNHRILVDVASAAAFLIKKYGEDGLPPEFVNMYRAMQSMQTVKSIEQTSPDDLEKRKPRKSIVDGNETKIRHTLLKLLYVVVEQEIGWSNGDEVGRERTVRRILEAIDLHDFKSTRGLSSEKIEEYLLEGAALAPLLNLKVQS